MPVKSAYAVLTRLRHEIHRRRASTGLALKQRPLKITQKPYHITKMKKRVPILLPP